MFGTKAVWWDINTCPVPEGYDPSHVRQSIESTLERFHGLKGPVAIFCVGNLESVSPRVLKAISSSGILIRHAPLGGIDMYHLLHEWGSDEHNRSYVRDIMLISGDPSWKNDAILSLGFTTVFRVFPDPRPKPFEYYQPFKDRERALSTILEGVLWERLLKEKNSGRVGKSCLGFVDRDKQILKKEPAWFCTVCEIPSRSCDDFINHIRSTKHRKECMDSEFVNNNPALFCELCKNPGDESHNKTIHHNNDVSSFCIRKFKRYHRAEGFHVNTTTGVWWDINTCPIPDGFDPRYVRPCIESALNKYQGPDRPVTIFCVGYLDTISPQVLKEISSSGIILRYLSSSSNVIEHMRNWKRHNPPPANIMLISSDSSWFGVFFHQMGYVILRAFSNPRPPSHTYKFAKEWVWESLLKENSARPVETNSQILKDVGEPAWFCKLCNIPSESCDDFINHIKNNTEHQNKLWWSVNIGFNGDPVFLCELCQYPGSNLHHMTIHLTSKQHAQKVLEYEQAGA